jgi:hypothetical protein
MSGGIELFPRRNISVSRLVEKLGRYDAIPCQLLSALPFALRELAILTSVGLVGNRSLQGRLRDIHARKRLLALPLVEREWFDAGNHIAPLHWVAVVSGHTHEPSGNRGSNDKAIAGPSFAFLFNDYLKRPALDQLRIHYEG